MKRIISFALVLILCFALTACGDKPDEVVPTHPNTTTTTQSQQTTTLPDSTTTQASPEGESSTTTTTKPVTTKPSTTKPVTTTTHVSADSVGLNIPRTEKITHYNINSSTFEITGKQERTITYKGTIRVGNTSAASGSYGSIGIPMNEGIKAYFNEINFNGGIGGNVANGTQGYYIEFIHYDDKYKPSDSLALTKTLVEQDEIFALVGQLGTPAVEATYNYIRQQGIISVGPYSNSDKLHFFALNTDEGAGIFPVFPVYYIEGQIIIGQLLSQYPTSRKIGVLYTNNELGTDIKDGVKNVLGFLATDFECTAVSFSSSSASITSALAQVKDCDAIIIAADAQNAGNVLKGMINNEIYLPVFTPDTAASGTLITAIQRAYNALDDKDKFPIYSTVWLDSYDVAGYLEFAEQVIRNMGSNEYLSNTYAMYGWIAADVFCEGLERVVSSGKPITAGNYIAAMESADVELKMAGGAMLNYQAGGRFGTTTFALLELTKSCSNFEHVTDLKDYLLFVLLKDPTYL